MTNTKMPNIDKNNLTKEEQSFINNPSNSFAQSVSAKESRKQTSKRNTKIINATFNIDCLNKLNQFLKENPHLGSRSHFIQKHTMQGIEHEKKHK